MELKPHVCRPLQILMALLFFSLLSFCLYAVLSHYLLLRRMKKHTTAIISSVMDSEWAIPIMHSDIGGG